MKINFKPDDVTRLELPARTLAQLVLNLAEQKSNAPCPAPW